MCFKVTTILENELLKNFNIMKSLKYLLIIPLALFATTLHNNIIITEPEPAKICVRIPNLDEFQDVVVFGRYDCVAMSKSKKAYKMEPNFIAEGNKTCPLSFYVMKLDYFKQKSLDEIDWDNDKNVQKLNLTVKANTLRSYDFSALEIDFNLACKDGTTYYLYKSKLTYKYRYSNPFRNGGADSIQTFKDDIVDPLKPISVTTRDAKQAF